jgi:hypothetical protein
VEQATLEDVLGTVHALLDAEGMYDAANLVREHRAEAVQTGYDNWNGGTEIWEVQFEVPAHEFARLGIKRAQLEEQISARLKTVLEQDTQDWYSAKITPRKVSNKDWRTSGGELPKQVRVNILDGLRLDNVAWSGQLDDVEFLNRIYELEQLPSTDSRFTNAAGDIWQHRMNNDDWDRDWLYSDSRFNLVDGPQSVFCDFYVKPSIRSSGRRGKSSSSWSRFSTSNFVKLAGNYMRRSVLRDARVLRIVASRTIARVRCPAPERWRML